MADIASMEIPVDPHDPGGNVYFSRDYELWVEQLGTIFYLNEVLRILSNIITFLISPSKARARSSMRRSISVKMLLLILESNQDDTNMVIYQ